MLDNLLNSLLASPVEILWILFWLVILQIGDALTTIEILRLGGYERNPIMKWLMGMLGVGTALTVKVIVASLLGAWLAVNSSLMYLGAAVVFYIGIVLNNAIVLRRLKDGS